MNLDDLLNEMSEKMRNRDLSDEYLREHNNSTREEIGIGEYAYGITMIPCEWVYKYLSDYKRVLKENERYKKSDYETICLENNELREITDRIQSEYNDLLKDNFKLKYELETKRKEYQETYKDVREELRELKQENEELKNKLSLKQFDVNIVYNDYLEKLDEYERNNIPKSKLKDIIDRIDYDIKKTKEIISKNTNIYASYRKNDYQIVRLRAMNTKSLDIKKRLQELLESEE